MHAIFDKLEFRGSRVARYVGEMVLWMVDGGSNGTLWDRKDVSLSLLFERTAL